MGVADLIISGALKKKKKEENTYNVKDGTYTAEAVKSTNKKVKDTVDTFNNVSDRIKSNTTMSFDDDNKTYKTKSTITDEKKQNKTKKENAKKTFDFSADDESVIKPSLKGEDLTKTDKKNIYNQYKTLSDKQDKLVDKQRGKNSKKVLEEYSQLDKERKEKWKNPSITLDEALDKNSVYTKNYGKEELSNAVSKKDKDKLSDLTNTQKYTTYLKNAAYEDTKESTALDKVFGPLAQAGGLVTGLTKILPSTRYKDENGNYIYLPNKLDLYTQRVQNDYDTKFGKFYGDVAGGASKIAASELVNLAAPGVGSGLYYGSMFGENIADANNKQVNLNGKNDGARTLINAGIKTGLEFLTGKFLGSATKGLTGGTASELEKGISNKVYNKLSKLGIEDSTLKTFASNLTGKIGSEGTEEFSQNYLENMTDIITLGSDGKHTNILKMISDPDVLSDAIYAGLVGGATGGLFGAVSGDATNVDIRINKLNLFKNAIEEDINNTTDPEKKQNLQNIIDNINKNLQNPFSIEEDTMQDIDNDIISNINTDNDLYSNINEENVQTPYEEEIGQITPLNEINQELQEVRQNDIEDSVQALNLEEDVDEDINTVETLEEETIANSFETYLKENNIGNLTKEDIQNFIQKAIEEQGNISEEQKVELQNKYFDSIMNYIDEKIKPVETPETPIQETEQQIKPETLNEETPNTYIKNVDNRITPESIKQENKTESKQNNIGEQFINQFKANENKAMESLDKTSKMFNLDKTKEFTQKEGNYVYVSHENPKIDAFRRSAATYMTNSPKTQNFVRTLEKIIKDKNVEIRFDPNLRDSQGRVANGSYSDGVITLNPNSNRAGEFLTIHELTHAIGTKSMIKMIQKYRKSNAEFDSAVKRLLTTYKATEINEEALADIAGQLFGNQEYINNLSMENPSLFKRIYNNIKYMWHKLRGYKNQSEFVEDLYNKWESAYRNNVAKKGTGYSYSINESIPLKESNTGKELSKEQQQFFKDTKVRDNDGNLITVYHTMTDRGPQFNEFNPTGSDYYKFGDQVVNYYTDDKNMSGSYADQRYEMADTKKISSIEEAEKIVNQFNGDSPNETIKIEKNGNGYKLVNNLYKNAYEKAKTIWENEITDEEKKIEKDYEELYKRYVESGYDNNLVPEFTSLENYAKEYSQKLDKLNDSMTPEERNAFLSFRKSDVKVETNPIVIAEYETEDKLFRNLKQDIQKADDESQHKYQYEGYVNITNPYIIDAEGRTWNKVESKADSEITKELLKVNNEDRQYLERLASDSIKTYNDNLFNYQQAERAVNDFAVDRTNTTLEQRLIHRTIHDLGFEDFMKVLNSDKNVYWGRKEQFMDDAFNNGFATYKQRQDFNKSGNIPVEVLEKIDKLVHEPVKYEDRYLRKELEAMGMPPEIKETTIYDLWNNQDKAYKTFDEGGRYEYSKFNNQVNEKNLYRAIDNEILFKVAKKGFTDENVRLLYNDWSVTNDIVKSIIELNKAGENYDGVIMKNVVDYGGESKEHTPHDLYITFNSNQFKAVDNTNPTEDPDIRYSKDNQAWREYLEKEFPSQGTRTDLGEITGRNKPKQENKTTQEEKPQEMPKKEVKQEVKKSYLTNAEQNELENLRKLDNTGLLEETDADYKRLQELEKKSQGLVKNYPDLKTDNTFDDIKNIYRKYKDNEISKENRDALRQAKSFIPANNQGRRTMEQWKQVAEFMGSNADIKSSEDLQKLAIETWFETRPNAKEQLNRQGKKYVPFAVQDWVNAVYKGAGVGTDVKMSIEETTPKVKNEINENKQDEKLVLRTPTQIEPKEMPKNPVADSVKVMNLEKENIKYSAEEKIEKSVRNQYKGLSEDKIQQIIELKEEQKEKDKMYSNFSNKQRAKQRIMINAYETNAKIRKIVQGDSLEKVKGGLTDTELAKAIEKENSNYIGKKVIVDGQNGTVIGNPYGRVKVEFEDGTIKTVDKSDVKSINESKKDEVLTLKDTNGKKVDLKPSGNNTYEQVNVKPKKNDVIPDMSNKVLNIGNEKVSNFYSNITEKSKFITEENRIKLMGDEDLKYYDAITNKDTLQNAMDKLDKNPEQQVGDFFAKKDFNAEDVATGWILVKRYQDAGNFEAMSNVIEKMREQGTKAGQAVQAYGILQRLTPEGMEYYSQKQLDKAFNEYSKNKSKKQIEKYAKDFTLTAKEHQFIKDTMKKVEKMKDEEAKKVEIAKIVSMLSDKMPPERGQRLKAWMRISMLGNPKTQVRNVAGNAIIQPVNWVGDIFAATADKIMAKQTGKRTIGTTDFGALARGTKQGLKDAIRDAKTGVDTRDINLDRFEENIGSKPFYEGHNSKLLNTAAKALNKTNKILGNIMSGGDRIFYQGIYENSLANQMKLNNVTKPTQEMKNIAEQEALSRTWNDSNEYTKAVLQIRNAMNKLNVKGYGLGDVLVPFAKTPANLTKAIVDYSPVGLTRSILQDGKNYKNSLENGQYSPELQHKFAESLGKGMAGSLLYVAAAALAKAGITSGASDDDKDVANFMRNTLGIQPYSVKIGDKSFTYDWAQPIAAPFAIMADAKRISEKENQELGDIITTATSSASNILLEQSFLSSIQDVFNSYEGPSAAIKQQIQDLPARATPTFFKQIADLIDPTSRQTFVKGNEKETLKNKVQVKIPGASKELVSQRDTLGREIQKYGGDEDKLKYAFNVFLNPANTNKGKTSQAAEEIYSIYKATGDKTIMPRQVGYSENIGGSTRNLTAKERNELQKLSGQKIEENVKALTQSSKYNSMSNEDKAAVINGIVNYSYAKAKSDLFDTNISTMYKTAAKKEEQGIPLYDYYINRVSKRR